MLRKVLKDKIKLILNSENIPFKILIMDDNTKDILSTLFKVSDLRNNGVCFQSLISNARTAVKDISAIYLISDINAATEDILRFLYSTYSVYCSTQIKRADLESMAVKISETQNANRILKVQDSFIQFIPLHEDLFTFNLKDSFIRNYTSEVISGLFSIFVTLNEIPFIVTNPNLSKIMKKLELKIKFTKIIKSSIKRPLLILIDRNIDLISPTSHTISYLDLINDIFNINLNKIEILEKNGENKKINIDPETEFLERNRFEDFPVVAELVEEELHSYKKELALRNLKNTSDMTKVLENAPELQKKNEIINTNLNICIKILEIIKERKLDDFYHMEKNFNKDEIMALSEFGTKNDIIRFCVNLIGTKNSDLIEPILIKRNIKTEVINFIKKMNVEEGSVKNMLKNLIFKKNIPVVNYVEDVISKIKNSTISEFYETGSYHNGIYLPEISKIIVYIDGGATYLELKELKIIEKKYNIPVILGGSEILNADNFLEQIELKSSLENIQ